MFEWMTENRQWIFEGLGTLLIGGTGTYLYRWGRKRRAKPSFRPNEPASTQAPKVTRRRRTAVCAMSFSDIQRQINATSPYMRETASRQYEGLFVEWPGEVSAVSAEKNGMLKVTLGLERGIALFTVNAAECPLVKVVPPETTAIAKGFITHVGTHHANLEEVELSFPDYERTMQ